MSRPTLTPSQQVAVEHLSAELGLLLLRVAVGLVAVVALHLTGFLA